MKETPISKDGLAQKLRALQNMTVDNGCTESEALVLSGKLNATERGKLVRLR